MKVKSCINLPKGCYTITDDAQSVYAPESIDWLIGKRHFTLTLINVIDEKKEEEHYTISNVIVDKERHMVVIKAEDAPYHYVVEI